MQNEIKPKRNCKAPYRKWTISDQLKILRFLRENRPVEKPTAQVYYRRYSEEYCDSTHWSIIRSKVKNMRYTYRKAKALQHSMGIGAITENGRVPDVILKHCPLFVEFEKVFGGYGNAFEIVLLDSESSNTYEADIEKPERYTQDIKLEIDYEDTTEQSQEFTVDSLENPAACDRQIAYSPTHLSDVSQAHETNVEQSVGYTRKVKLETADDETNEQSQQIAAECFENPDTHDKEVAYSDIQLTDASEQQTELPSFSKDQQQTEETSKDVELQQKRTPKTAYRKWTILDEQKLLRFLRKNRPIEKPTAQMYYRRYCAENRDNSHWSIVRSKVKHMRQGYKRAKALQERIGVGDGILRHCPLFKELEAVFGGHSDPFRFYFQNLENSYTYEKDFGKPEDSMEDVQAQTACEETNERSPTTSQAAAGSVENHARVSQAQTQTISLEKEQKNNELKFKKAELQLQKEKFLFERKKHADYVKRKDKELDVARKLRILELKMEREIALKKIEMKERVEMEKLKRHN